MTRHPWLIEFLGGQPAVPRGDAQHIHGPLPVRIRGPHPRRFTTRRKICQRNPSVSFAAPMKRRHTPADQRYLASGPWPGRGRAGGS
jgi:hypothetical protein